MPADDRYTFGIPNPADPRSARWSPGTGTHPVTNQFAYGPPPQTRTRPGCNRVRDEWPDVPNSIPSYGRLSPEAEQWRTCSWRLKP